MKNGINESTPVSMGVATAIVALALSFGMGIEHMRSRVVSTEHTLKEQATWNASVDTVLTELKDITKRHQWIIERMRKESKDATATTDLFTPTAS